jgi:hypothetical protein
MRVDETGVAVRDLIAAVKRAITTANLSSGDSDRDLRVGAVRLTLNTVAVQKAGGAVDFRIPVLGMRVKLGHRHTGRNTHVIRIDLVPPDLKDAVELRGPDLEPVLVQAIETVRGAVAGAAGGDDPFELRDSTVEISFAVTDEGTISLGVEGELTDESAQTLELTLIPAR